MKNVRVCLALILSLMLAVAGVAQAEAFTGEAQGFGGAVTVTLTMDGDKIAGAAIEGAQETEAIGGAAFAALAEQIVAAQSAEIDGVAGATVTSNAVKDAAAKAIAAAKGETAAEVKLVPGTYTSVQMGYQDCLATIEVTLDETSIVSVEVVKSDENPRVFASRAWEQIPAAIVENQTYNVDAVSGVTVTSNLIMAAVRDCLEQAGGAGVSIAFLEPVVKPEIVAGEDAHTDVLVIGGGGAGMMAAFGSYFDIETAERSGLDVMVVEKADLLGGSTSLAGGYRYIYTDETGKYDEAWLENTFVQEKAVLEANSYLPIHEELLRNELKIMPKANVLMDKIGFSDLGTVIFNPPPYEVAEPGLAIGMVGCYFNYYMDDYLPKTEIDVRLNTEATKLITDETGAVIGATVQDKTTTYNIYADKVVLACGGFPHNPEMIAEYAPEYVGTLVYAAGTNTGDGFRMAQEVGAVTVGDSMLGYLGEDGSVGIMTQYLPFTTGKGMAMDVNVNGERFCDESLSVNKRYYEVLQQPEDMAWGIADSNNPNGEALINSKSKCVFRADTIEELAALIGVPADKLVETTNAYNAAFDAGVDEAFGCPAEKMDRIDTAPYFGFALRPVALSSLVGLEIDGECRVLNADGEVIENLYAAGDMIFGGNKLSFYVGGHGVGTAIYTGTLAGQTAKTDLLNK